MNETARTRKYGYRWVVLGIYIYLAALSQIYWLNFAAIHTFMEEQLHFSSEQLVLLTSIFLVTFVILTIPAGIIIDKKGFRYSLILGAFLTGAFPIMRLFAPTSFIWLFILQILISVGAPFIMNAVTKLCMTWFSLEEEGFAIGLGVLAVFAGILIAVTLTTVFVARWDYHNMLLFYGLLGLIGIIAAFFIKAKPPTPTRTMEKQNDKIVWGGIKNILQIKYFVLLSWITLLSAGVFIGFISWNEKVLHDYQHIDLIYAGDLSGLFILSGMIGCFVIPYLSDKTKKRKLFLIICLTIAMLSMASMTFPSGITLNIINSILLGFFLLPTMPLIFTLSAEMTGIHLTGIAVGFLQLIANGAGVILTWLAELFWRLGGNFMLPLIIFATFLLAGLIMTFFIRE